MTRSTSDVAVCCSSRLAQFARALLLGLEQPGILDRNYRLVGKCRRKLDLLVCEGVHFMPMECKDADRRSVAQQGHAKIGPETECLLIADRGVFGVGEHVRDMTSFALQNGSA